MEHQHLAKTEMGNNQLGQALTPKACTTKLINCIVNADKGDVEAKFELVAMTSTLMPHGNPDLIKVAKYPPICKLVEEMGPGTMAKVMFALVKDFCNSMNVVRNMNESQMFEAASMLLDECDTFRVEDYHMMFTMAKRGRLVKILDRVDIQVIGIMMDEYYLIRRQAGERHYEQQHIDERTLLESKIKPQEMTEEDKLAGERFSEITKQLTDWNREDQKQRDLELQAKKAEWAQQYANRDGITLEQVIAEFGKSADGMQVADLETEIEVLYSQIKKIPEGVELLAERLYVSKTKISNIAQHKIKEKNQLTDFIRTAKSIIQEYSQNKA